MHHDDGFGETDECVGRAGERDDAEPHSTLAKRRAVNPENKRTGEDYHRDARQKNPKHPLRDARECHRGMFLVALDRQAGDDRREDRVEGLVEFTQAAGGFDRRPVNAEGSQRHARRAPDKPSEHHDVETNDDGVKQIVSADWCRVSEQAAGFCEVRKIS